MRCSTVGYTSRVRCFHPYVCYRGAIWRHIEAKGALVRVDVRLSRLAIGKREDDPYLLWHLICSRFNLMLGWLERQEAETPLIFYTVLALIGVAIGVVIALA